MPVSRKNKKRGRKTRCSEASRARKRKKQRIRKAETAMRHETEFMARLKKEMGLKF